MASPKSIACSRCGRSKDDADAFRIIGTNKDGSVRLSYWCKPCKNEDARRPEKLEKERVGKARRRRQAGIPLQQRNVGPDVFCPQGHPKIPENLRPGRSDCAVCHREQQTERNRARGVAPQAKAGERWTCLHDPLVAMRYVNGKPKGCGVCHRESARGGTWYNLERSRAYQRRNRKRLNEYRKAWAAVKLRRGADFRQGGAESIEYAAIIIRDPCVYCGQPSTEVDHIKAVTRGGGGSWENLAPICRSCNASKNTKDVLQFMLYRSAARLKLNA